MKRKHDLIDGNNGNDNDSNSDGDGNGESSFSEMEINNNGSDNVERSQETVKEAERVVTVRPDRVIQRQPPMAVYGRVRVKLKTAAKPQPPSQPQPQLQSEPQPQPGVVEAKGGGVEGVSNGSEVDKSMEEVRGEKTEGGGVGSGKKVVLVESGNSGSSEGMKSGGGDEIMEEVGVDKTDDGVGSGEKMVVAKEIGKSVSDESEKSGGIGVKIVSSKSLNLSTPSGGDGSVKEMIGSGVLPKEDVDDGELMKDSVKSGIVESKKFAGMGIKIVSSKSSSLSTPSGGDDGSVKEIIGSGVLPKEGVDDGELMEDGGKSGLVEGKKFAGMGIKIVSSKSSSLSTPSGGDGSVKEIIGSGVLPKEDIDDGELMEDSGKSGLVEGKKIGGMGIKIVSSKSSSLSSPNGGDDNVKESGGGKESPKADMKGSELVDESGKSGLAEVKKSGGIGIKIVSSKSSNLTPPGGDGNVKESGEGRISPKADIKGSELGNESGKSGLAEVKKSGGIGIKIVSSKTSNLSPSGGDSIVKESGASGMLPKSDLKEKESVEERGKLGSSEGKNSGGMGIKIVSSKSSNSSPSGGEGRGLPKEDVEEGELVEASGNSGLAEGKKFDGVGIKIVSSKSSNSSPLGGGNVKESGASGMLPKSDLKEKETVEERGKLGSSEGKNSGGIGIKIVSSKSSNSSPSGGEGRGLPKEDVEEGELVEASGNSGLAEGKKFDGMGIKIVSSKSSNSSPLGGGNVKESCGSGVLPKADVEEGGLVEVKEEKPKSFNLQELEASLEVIKKVMRMDGAGPFIAPVNPVELGIPDYFDVIDTPMDFGTIRNNLESRIKYMDSEDVYKDAQYVWDNCFKYNNKGDYIVDLMKRVKKNFMKYWVAAGLYTEQTKKMTGGENTGADEPTTSGNGKKLKKGKGYMLHKEDCLCAICVRRRRRREREAREAEEARAAGIIIPSPHIRVPQTSMAGGYKQEENLHSESPGENTSSYMATSPGGEGDADMEDEEIRLESIGSHFYNQPKAAGDRIVFHDKYGRSGDISETLPRNDKGVTELYSHDNTGSRMMIDTPKHPSVHPEGPSSEYLKQRHEQMELEKKRQRLRLLETFRDLENPMLAELCGTLFPNNVQSVWNGANSLLRGQKSHRQKSGIHEAVASFVLPSCKSASSLK